MRACVFSLKVTHDLEAGASENLLLLLVGETNKKKCLDALDLNLHFEKVRKSVFGSAAGLSLARSCYLHFPRFSRKTKLPETVT